MLPCGKTVDRGGEVSDIDQISVQGGMIHEIYPENKIG